LVQAFIQNVREQKKWKYQFGAQNSKTPGSTFRNKDTLVPGSNQNMVHVDMKINMTTGLFMYQIKLDTTIETAAP